MKHTWIELYCSTEHLYCLSFFAIVALFVVPFLGRLARMGLIHACSISISRPYMMSIRHCLDSNLQPCWITSARRFLWVTVTDSRFTTISSLLTAAATHRRTQIRNVLEVRVVRGASFLRESGKCLPASRIVHATWNNVWYITVDRESSLTDLNRLRFFFSRQWTDLGYFILY